MITFRHKGNFNKTLIFFKKSTEVARFKTLEKYGKIGVDALEAASPKETGLMANSWYYKIENNNTGASIIWCNSDIENGFAVAIGVQYGHGTGNGAYVTGTDYINPAMKSVFGEIADNIWREVIRL